MSKPAEPKWLLLIHQIPPKPNYFRVKIGRRLQRLGAAAIKNSVYVLPKCDQSQEDFEWVVREIVEGGGEASVCEARFVEGLSDAEVEGLFNSAREADYLELASEARRLPSQLPRGKKGDDYREELESAIARLRKRLEEIERVDFFSATGRDAVEALLVDLEEKVKTSDVSESQKDDSYVGAVEKVQGRVWVTRKGIHVDRIASAWLIRRFIDKDARFKFVPGKGYRPDRGELRFDMFEAEFTHEGDRCTFEVLLQKFGLTDSALKQIAEIVHDIDLKDEKFAREDALGLDRLIAGIAMAHPEDEKRLAEGSAVFNSLYEYFKRKRA
ncbi:MAG TPA: chromate resistance protein ChrB domain-containing protein [Myxococcaceae bacterium]|nr:chromate resistance protein ChrB domain-containing protein [Myxococcaceae bacterium]